MKLVVAATGASGAIYFQRLLAKLDPTQHEVHVVLSAYAHQVFREEIGSWTVPDGFRVHGDKTMQVPFVSGSAHFDAMVVQREPPIPRCSGLPTCFSKNADASFWFRAKPRGI